MKVKKLLVLTLIIFSSSCSLKSLRPYRATIGPVGSSSEFISETKDGDERVICVESTQSVNDVEICGDGYKKDEGVGYIEPWLEFTPTFFKSSQFGWSYFFGYNQSSTKLLDYPIEGDKTEVDIERFSLNPFVFYNWGDKFFKGGKGMAFRLGLGASLNYVSRFDLERTSNNETFEASNKFSPGTSFFMEFSWNWFILRVEQSSIEYDDNKFEGVEPDTLRVVTSKASFLYAYYF
ncbi:MAG: hypothetical protein CME64_03315 [Halobacteriovoraceae bacterium]|nr:hypothetical protein [Halobacteriovoraceae bacterium]